MTNKVTNYNYNKPKSQYRGVWDFINFKDLQAILIYGTNWTEVFDKKFIFPIDKKGNKKETTQWLIDLHIISNKIEHSSTITLEKFEFVKSVYIWLKNLLKETNKVYS